MAASFTVSFSHQKFQGSPTVGVTRDHQSKLRHTKDTCTVHWGRAGGRLRLAVRATEKCIVNNLGNHLGTFGFIWDNTQLCFFWWTPILWKNTQVLNCRAIWKVSESLGNRWLRWLSYVAWCRSCHGLLTSEFRVKPYSDISHCWPYIRFQKLALSRVSFSSSMTLIWPICRYIL